MAAVEHQLYECCRNAKKLSCGFSMPNRKGKEMIKCRNFYTDVRKRRDINVGSSTQRATSARRRRRHPSAAASTAANFDAPAVGQRDGRQIFEVGGLDPELEPGPNAINLYCP